MISSEMDARQSAVGKTFIVAVPVVEMQGSCRDQRGNQGNVPSNGRAQSKHGGGSSRGKSASLASDLDTATSEQGFSSSASY